jgi:hypothetical protein
VAWISEGGGDCPPGMGIRFVCLSSDDLAAIEEFCRERTPIERA